MARTLSILSVFLVLIPIVIGISSVKRQSQIGIAILILCIISFSCDLLSYAWAVWYHINYWVIHLYHVLEMIILGMFFTHFLKSKKHSLIFLTLSVMYTIDLILVSGFNQINSGLIGVEGIIIMGYCLFGLYILFQTQEYSHIDQAPPFWFVIGIMTYFTGSLFSWLLFNVIHQDDGGGTGIWAFHNIANILKNVLFAIGLWKARAIS